MIVLTECWVDNLRYAFTSCVFGTPESVNNISTQCTVSCQQLDSALEFEIADPDGDNLDTWCGSNAFADNAISQCEQCYNLTDNQNYMSNCTSLPPLPVCTAPCSTHERQILICNESVLEALRYNCHFRTPPTESFPISPARIFSESMLPSSTTNLLAPKSGKGVNLAVVIAIPILAFVIVVCALTVCCFFFVRHRRKKARQLREERELNRFHAGWSHHHSLAQAQAQVPDGYDPAAAVGMHHPYAYGSGGVGYGKQAQVMETGVAAPGTVYAPEKEGKKEKGPVKG